MQNFDFDDNANERYAVIQLQTDENLCFERRYMEQVASLCLTEGSRHLLL